MKKKLIALGIAAATIFSSTAFADTLDKVEISFRVGESSLLINGSAIDVETPYVVGEGTTLVPLRVITEAFGAEVSWEGETKTVTLTYPEVNISLQVGNKIATVNSHSEELPEAPALSANGVTMVPLRFISETFGADVAYDNENSAIRVTKESIGSAQTVVGMTDMERTGDSYYNWSINTPKQMQMTYRRPDGLRTVFTADDDSKMYIDIYYNDKDDLISFDEEYANIKNSFSGYTLTEAEKLTDKSGNQYMHFRAKDSSGIIDYYEYYGKDYMTYEIVSAINVADDVSIRDMMFDIAGSFEIGSIDSNTTYNLSNVEDGMRLVKDDTYGISFKVPADFYMTSTTEDTNEFSFFSPDKYSVSQVNLGIYSKSDDVTAKALAEKDHLSNVEVYNPDLVTVSDVEENEQGYSYTITANNTKNADMNGIDMFFEKGDYVYNFTVILDSDANKTLSDKIVSSLKTDTIDFNNVGKLLRNDDEDITTSLKFGKYKFNIPTTWKNGVISNNGATVFNKTGSVISVMVVEDKTINQNSLSEVTGSIKDSMMMEENAKIEHNVDFATINGKKFSYFVLKNDDDNSTLYATTYICCESNKAIVFSLMQDEINYNSKEADVFLEAINSFDRQ